MKAFDKKRMTGYYKKWHDRNYYSGLCIFHNVLKPCASLSLALQAEYVNIFDAIEAALRTNKNIELLNSTDFGELATVSNTKVREQYHLPGENTSQIQ